MSLMTCTTWRMRELECEPQWYLIITTVLLWKTRIAWIRPLSMTAISTTTSLASRYVEGSPYSVKFLTNVSSLILCSTLPDFGEVLLAKGWWQSRWTSSAHVDASLCWNPWWRFGICYWNLQLALGEVVHSRLSHSVQCCYSQTSTFQVSIGVIN